MTDIDYPETIDEAVDHLVELLPMKEQVLISRMDELELVELRLSLGVFTRNLFGLWDGNTELLDACASESPDEATEVIINALWQHLHDIYTLKLVK